MKRFFILLSISLFALTACIKGDGGAEVPKSYIIDASAMDATTLNCAVDEALKLGYTDLVITLTANPEIEKITAIRRAICDAESISDGSINLTLAGVKVIPDATGNKGDSFGRKLEPNGSVEVVTRIASINLPAVEYIGDYTFQYCTVASVNAPALQELGDLVFYESGIRSIYIPATVTEISDRAFQNCQNLASVEIMSGVTTIGANAFHSCTALKSVKFASESRLEYIGEFAFENTGLESITIPSSVTNLEERSFQYNENLKTIKFQKDSQLKSIKYQTVYQCPKLTSFVIPKGVTCLENQSFQECGITSIVIPNTVTSMNGAFAGCYPLEEVIFEEGCELTEIGVNTFMMTNLISIKIPASITKLAGGSFYQCKALKSVTLLASEVVAIESDTFYESDNLTSIYVPADLVDDYKVADVWRDYSEKIEAIAAK